MDLRTLIRERLESGDIWTFANDARSGFRIELPDGTTQEYIGARYLPLVNRENLFEDTGFAWRSPIAQDGTRLSRVPLRGGFESAAVPVRLGTNDAGSLLTAADWDVITSMIRQGNMDGADSVLQDFLLTTIVKPLNDIIEKQRWQSILDGEVIRQGDQGYQEVVGYENPDGHRVYVEDGWMDPDVDPFEAIFAARDLMGSVTAIVTSQAMVSRLSLHPQVKARAGLTTIVDGQLRSVAGRVYLDNINAMLSADGINAPITVVETWYEDVFGARHRFFREDAFALLNTSSVDEAGIDADPSLLRPTTLGYVGNGIPAGRQQNGRWISMRVNDEQKAPSVETEGTQETLPVLRNREGSQRLMVMNIEMEPDLG